MYIIKCAASRLCSVVGESRILHLNYVKYKYKIFIYAMHPRRRVVVEYVSFSDKQRIREQPSQIIQKPQREFVINFYKKHYYISLTSYCRYIFKHSIKHFNRPNTL